MGSTQAVARSLVAGLLTDQVSERGLVLQRMFAVGAALAVAAWLFLDGWYRWLVAPLLVLCAVGFLAMVAGRRLLLRAIARIAPPRHLADVNAAVRHALDEADLPNSPLAVARMVWRLRRGVTPELRRLRTVVDKVASEL